MESQVIKLINILQEKFYAPDKTDGKNILYTYPEVVAAVSDYWPAQGSGEQPDWTDQHLINALDYLKFDSIIKIIGQKVYFMAPR